MIYQNVMSERKLFRKFSKYTLRADAESVIIYLDIYLNTITEVRATGFAETFKALADPVRRDILQLLKKGRMSAGDIGTNFDMTGATISYHLSILKKADLVVETREKNYIYYELNTSVLEEVMLWLSELKEE